MYGAMTGKCARLTKSEGSSKRPLRKNGPAHWAHISQSVCCLSFAVSIPYVPSAEITTSTLLHYSVEEHLFISQGATTMYRPLAKFKTGWNCCLAACSEVTESHRLLLIRENDDGNQGVFRQVILKRNAWLACRNQGNTRISDHALQILSSEKCKESITPQTWRLKTGNG